MSKNDEALIQIEIVKYLQKAGVFSFAVSNEAYGRSKVQQMQLVSMGLRSGVSDLVLWLPMPDDSILHHYVEVKKPTGKQSTMQKKFQSRCEQHGISYTVVYSVSDVEKILQSHIDKYWDSRP